MAWCHPVPEESHEKYSWIAGTSRKSMRSFASLLVVIAIGASAAPVVRAGQTNARTLYTEALVRERVLRHDLETRRSDDLDPALLKRMRTLVKSYEQMSRLFQSSA